MKVTLLAKTSNPIDVLYAVGRVRSEKWLGKLLPQELGKEEFVKKLIVSGNESILEHIHFTFFVENISVATTRQLNGKVVTTYSNRIVDNDLTYIVPDSICDKIADNEKVIQSFSKCLTKTSDLYYQLIDIGIPPEDAWSILTNGLASSIVFTMNGRELREFLKSYLVEDTQKEIQKLAYRILSILDEECPIIVFDIKDKFPIKQIEDKRFSTIYFKTMVKGLKIHPSVFLVGNRTDDEVINLLTERGIEVIDYSNHNLDTEKLIALNDDIVDKGGLLLVLTDKDNADFWFDLYSNQQKRGFPVVLLGVDNVEEYNYKNIYCFKDFSIAIRWIVGFFRSKESGVYFEEEQ